MFSSLSMVLGETRRGHRQQRPRNFGRKARPWPGEPGRGRRCIVRIALAKVHPCVPSRQPNCTSLGSMNLRSSSNMLPSDPLRWPPYRVEKPPNVWNRPAYCVFGGCWCGARQMVPSKARDWAYGHLS